MALLTLGARVTALGVGGYAGQATVPSATTPSTGKKSSVGLAGVTDSRFNDPYGANFADMRPKPAATVQSAPAAAPAPVKIRGPLDSIGRKKTVYARPGG
jgi:hypothetical protein